MNRLISIGMVWTFILLATQSALAQTAFDWSRYDYVDPQKIVPTEPLKRLIKYYDSVRAQLKNPDFLTVIDFTRKNTEDRMFVIDMRSGLVKAYKVAHGIGSDPQKTGYARIFSNNKNSLMSSLGIAITQETYVGKWGYSLRLHGLEKSNNLLRQRAIVVHWADYVDPSLDPIGMSEGCLVLEQKYHREVIDKIANGSLIISWIDPKVPHQNLSPN
jgi:hypothetical protein